MKSKKNRTRILRRNGDFGRHGDVGILRVPSPPQKGRSKISRLTLADGDATGHSHRLVDFAKSGIVKGEHGWEITAAQTFPADAELYMFEGTMYAQVRKRSAVIHHEHKPIVMDRGTYQIRIQREWSPEGNQRVQD